MIRFHLPDIPSNQGGDHEGKSQCQVEPHVTAYVKGEATSRRRNMDEAHAEECLGNRGF